MVLPLPSGKSYDCTGAPLPSRLTPHRTRWAWHGQLSLDRVGVASLVTCDRASPSLAAR